MTAFRHSIGRRSSTAATRLFLVALLRLLLGLRFVSRCGLCVFALLAFFLGDRLVDNDRRIHPFEERDRGRVALANTETDDPGVTAVAIGRARRDIVEQFLYRVLLAQNGERGAPRMERTLFAESHHLFRERTNSLRLGQGRLDAVMLDQTANLIG